MELSTEKTSDGQIETQPEDVALSVPGTTARAWIKGLTFSSGKSLSLVSDSILVLIGPNNAGKSQTLRDCLALIEDGRHQGIAVSQLAIDRSGDLAAFWAHFARWGTVKPNGHVDIFGGISLPQTSVLDQSWENPRGLKHATLLFAILLTADKRLLATKPAQKIRRGLDRPTVPLHQLEFDEQDEKRTSDAFKEIFGNEIALDRNAGGHTPVHVGIRPDPTALGGQLSVQYERRFRGYPLLATKATG